MHELDKEIEAANNSDSSWTAICGECVIIRYAGGLQIAADEETESFFKSKV